MGRLRLTGVWYEGRNMYLEGIDVSHFQGTVDWAAVADADIAFAFAKASEGQNTGDSMFATNWSAMKEAGLVRGAYEFYVVGESPQREAQNFIDRVRLEPGDLPPVVDVETMGHSSVDNATFLASLKQYLSTIESAYGVKPVLYTGPSFWAEHGDDSFADYPLWIARYAQKPSVPEGWTTWTFWQYSQSGAVPGVTGDVDRDRFQGDRDALLALTLR